jgi:hypothetical protein
MQSDLKGAQYRLSINVFSHLTGVRVGAAFSYGGFCKAWQRCVRAAGRRSRSARVQETAIRNLERDGVPRSVAMAMVGQKTGEVYRRYAIVDQAMIREAAIKDEPRSEGSANYCTTNCTIGSAIGGLLRSLGKSTR